MIPYLNNNELKLLVNNGKKLLVVNYYIYDVSNYYKNHPGGKCILKNVIKNINNKLILNNSKNDYNFHSISSKKIWKKLLIGTNKKKWYHYLIFI
jgi:cytochrome b involved in lipid metabolism